MFTKNLLPAWIMLVLLCLPILSTSQKAKAPNYATYPYWVEMMQDHSVNFFEVQEAFNQYWEGREVTKGAGFKPFKRWEYRMLQSGIYPDGTRKPDGYARDEYINYLQQHPGTRSPDGDWISLGPEMLPSTTRSYQGLGRLNAIAFHPSDPDILYVGSPSGGLWVTEQGGNDWAPLTDDQPTLGVSAIIVDYNDPDLIFIGTGDRDAGDAQGLGVYKSEDGGQSWAPWNNGMGNLTVGRLIQHPENNQIIIAATSGGIFKTTDGGASWSQKITGNFREVVFKADDPNIVFASANGNFYKSTNMAESFIQVTNGLPGGSRGVIGVTPANPNYIYFLLTNSDSFKGLYRSTNAGNSFTEKSTTPNIMSWGCSGGSGGQAWYDLDMAVDPFNADVIFAGGVNCFKSSNGGQTWQISSHWWGDCGVPAVHADLHVLEYNPINWTLYVGNDGGIYYTADEGSTWNLISNGLVISQVYKIGQSATVKDKVLNGYQDNGTSTYLGTHWQFTRGGDGMECAVDHENAAYSYATVYYGSIDRYYNNSYDANVASEGNYGINESGAWVTPFILDENDADVMFVGYKNVWRCTRVTGPSSQFDWTNISDGSFPGSDNMRVLEQSPANTDILFAARYDDRLFRTENARAASPDWVELTNFLPANGGVLDVECHPEDPDVVFISQENKIWRSDDRGLTWEDISGTLPEVSFTSIAYYERSHEGLYISSDIGVYYKDMFMPDWVMFSNGLPIDASIQEVEIYYDPDPAQDVIRAGTYGRGMWESDMYHDTPVADFIASDTLIPVNCNISFQDLSSGIPTSWNWTFDGALQNTSTEPLPEGISWDTPGTYQVKLVVENEAGMDSLTRIDYITVSDEILPEADFTASTTSACTNDYIYFTDLTKYCPIAWEWSIQPTSISFREGTDEFSQNPVVEFRMPGEYTISLTATNAVGNATTTKTDYIHAGGVPIPFEDDFEGTTFAERGWEIENPDLSVTWDNYQIEATGNHAARMKFYGYFKTGERDRLLSPFLNFDNFDEVYLSYKYAYAQRFSQIDSLIIYISDDCGNSWTRVYQGGPNGTGIFATAEPDPYEFIPEVEDEWCGLGYGAACKSIDLSAWAGQSDVRIMFEAFNGLGNSLYLDDIMVSNTTGLQDQGFRQEDRIAIYPNPNHGSFFISSEIPTGETEITVYDQQGRKVLREQIVPGDAWTKEIRIPSKNKGIYMIRIEGARVSLNKMLIVN